MADMINSGHRVYFTRYLENENADFVTFCYNIMHYTRHLIPTMIKSRPCVMIEVMLANCHISCLHETH